MVLPRLGRFLLVLLAACFLSAIFLLLLLAALHKPLNHDENMYVSSAILLDRGQLPYKDFAYFQMPLLTLFYAPAVWASVDPLLVARLLNTACAFLTCGVLFIGALALSRGASSFLRIVIAVSGVVLYVANPELIYASGLAWNHDLPILLTVTAISLLIWRYAGSSGSESFTANKSIWLLLASGVLLGLATLARLTFVSVVPVVAIMVAFGEKSDGSQSAKAGIRDCLIFGGGVLVGFLPGLFFFLADPAAFWFGNIAYHQLNEQYYTQLGYTRAMNLEGKLAYLSDVVFAEPFNWLLAAGAGLVSILLVWKRLASGNGLAAWLPTLTAIMLLVGGLAPTPTWLQYFYAPYVLLVFAFVFGVACLSTQALRFVSAASLIVVTIVCANAAFSRYSALDGTLTLADSVPAQVRTTALEVRGIVGSGTVVTFAPLYALEAGLNIYPELESGPFATRVAGQLSETKRAGYVMMSDSDLVAAMQSNPPSAILVGIEGSLEDPLTQFASQHSFEPVSLSNGLMLWVNPGQSAVNSSISK